MPHPANFFLTQEKRFHTLPQLALLSAILLLTACATQPPSQPSSKPKHSAAMAPPVSAAEQESLRSLVSTQERLYRVAAPLLVNNPELCKGNARKLLGFTAKNRYSYSDELMNAAQYTLGLDEQLQISGILGGSGAARTDVHQGDILVAVEDKPMPQGPNAERQAATILAPLVNNRSSIKLTLMRNGENMPLNVPLTFACAFTIELGNADNVNAYADGRRVLITRGMMNAIRSDEELAYVLAKEIAHNALRHASKQKMNATIGEIIDNLIRVHPDMSTMAGMAGIKPFPKELDAAADKLALYMLARANYSIDNAVPFWQQLANQYPVTVLNAYIALHPTTAHRISTMGKAIMEIKAKQAAGKPLLP